MRAATGLPKVLKCLTITFVMVVLLLPRAVHSYGTGEREEGVAISAPVLSTKLVSALRGTTRQADRIASAIEARLIRVEILSTAAFYKRYRLLDGQRSAQAFAYCSLVYLRANSPTIVSDLVHEGTHAMDCLSGRDRSRRMLELRAYWYERQFQKATGTRVQFERVVDLVWFVWGRYGDE